QVFVSMDPRYGPIFNKGVEENLVDVLHKQGYVDGSGVPITLIGYSGGAQISLGAALYLEHELGAPITVISLGGVLGDDPALATVEHLYHLWGTKDVEAGLAMLVVPARWPMAKRSRWNRALAAKRITQKCLGVMVHTGPKGYLDDDTKAPDGRSYLEVTAETMLEIIGAQPASTDSSRVSPAATAESGGVGQPVAT
ncbi:MAG TPA: CAAX protease, partial [Chloroflexota bacterium]|nr:CAAX protease [Chloroflexota bacterium]